MIDTRITDFQNDLQTGMTLNDALIKHDLTLKQVWQELNTNIAGRPTKKKPYKNNSGLDQTEEKYIYRRNDHYTIRKYSRGKTRMYGVYHTLEDAVLVRDYCEEHGWVQRNIDKYCQELGVSRCKGHRNCKVRYK